MNVGVPVLLASLALLSGCGYVGPVLPPSPQIPAVITDLSVKERGDKLVITFTTPPRTTDNLAIRKFSEIQLRVGEAAVPFKLDEWEAKTRTYEVSLPPENSADEARAVLIENTIPVQDWLGKHVAVMVRTAVKKGENYSNWSNRIELDATEPLAPPTLQVEATAAGYHLSWPSEGEHVHYNVLRRGPNDKEAVPIGSADASEFVDKTAAWETPYSYQIVATRKNAESLPSEPVSINAADTFAPAIPTDLSVSPTTDSIEASWNRSPEPDTAGYFVYRGENGGPLQKQGGLQPLPAYSDRRLTRGVTYKYAVSAVDRKGNESAQSAPVEIASPVQ